MRIEFKNGSVVESMDTLTNSIKSVTKSFEQMKWILGDVYKSLRWYQKFWIRVDYGATTIIDYILLKLYPSSYYMKYYIKHRR